MARQKQSRIEIRERAQAVADIAALHAFAVDRDCTFPKEAIDAAKRNGLLSLLIPLELEGGGASLRDVADVCYILGQSCASTAMIVAMHQASLACVVRHCGASEWHRLFLRRVATDNLLLASSTTEGQGGGNVRSSAAALMRDGESLSFERAATVMSYGAQADGIVTTARRDADASASDQALVVFLKEDYELLKTGGWDTLGMRGTCSAGFGLKARALSAQILPVGYGKIHPHTMVPVSHLTWASVWTGIAAAAVSRSQMFVRTAARRANGQTPPGAAACTRAGSSLRALRGIVAAGLSGFEAIEHDERALSSLDTQANLNLFKVEVSERAVETVMSSMRACGLAGYRNDGDFGIGRHLRDILSAPIMVHNERIMTNIASTALLGGVPASVERLDLMHTKFISREEQ